MDIRRFKKNENENPLDNFPINGGFCSIFRKIACIGDSLSSGEFESYENGEIWWHDYYDYSWGQFMARDIGSTVYNFSKGGLSAKEFDTFARENGFYDDKYKAQAYIIAFGVNDITQMMNGTLELGSSNDIDLGDYAKNKATFAGYYARIISKFKNLQPKAKFFLVTIPRGNEKKEREEFSDQHAELLHDIAKKFDNCYVIDLRKYASVYDDEFRNNFFLGGHMNPAGYRLTALMMESYIDYIIRNNCEDFKQIGFIGTSYHNANEKW